uniref:Small ribosomal subunit protein uS5 C-terminal domain-containing protein n=1 Tax=Cucumis sativus TaxID=3659 RepID=A0A0A0LKB1_CUCSA
MAVDAVVLAAVMKRRSGFQSPSYSWPWRRGDIEVTRLAVVRATYNPCYSGDLAVRMVPAPRGAGIVAAGVPKKVLQFADASSVVESTFNNLGSLDILVAAWELFGINRRFVYEMDFEQVVSDILLMDNTLSLSSTHNLYFLSIPSTNIPFMFLLYQRRRNVLCNVIRVHGGCRNHEDGEGGYSMISYKPI